MNPPIRLSGSKNISDDDKWNNYKARHATVDLNKYSNDQKTERVAPEDENDDALSTDRDVNMFEQINAAPVPAEKKSLVPFAPPSSFVQSPDCQQTKKTIYLHDSGKNFGLSKSSPKMANLSNLA